jgi:sugar lactone lactonase YvrE
MASTSVRRRVAARKSRLRVGAWVRSWFWPARRTKGTRQAAAPGYRRPLFEPLETRALLSALTAGALTPPHGSGGPTVSTFVNSGLSAECLAFDAAGNLYVSNICNNTISKVTPGGAVSAFVSSGLSGPIGPDGLAFDSAGNLYVGNLGNNTISKVTPDGFVSTFVSSGLNGPIGLAFSAGNLYVANENGMISKVTPTGVVSTFVSSGLSDPDGLAFDPASYSGVGSIGDLYVANENNTISKVTPGGAVSAFVSSGLSGPEGLAFDAAGNLYVANENNTISKVTPGGAVSTFVSSGLGGPEGLAFDAAGALYAANGQGTISKITPSIIEGQPFSGTVFHFTDSYPAATAADYTAVVTLGDGNTVTLNSSGVVSGPAGAGGRIVADWGGFDVQLSYTYALPLSNATFGGQVNDVRGDSTSASTGTFGVAVAALTAGALTPPRGAGGPTITTFVNSNMLDEPEGLAFDAAGNLYVSNIGNNTISKVTPGGAVSAFVNIGLNEPLGLAFDAAGNLYAANLGNSTISKVTPTGAVSTFATGTLISGPVGLAFDSAGNLYVSNVGNDTISKVTPPGAVSTFASNGLINGSYPADGLAFDSAGNLYVVNGNSTISKVTPAGVVSAFVSSGLSDPVGPNGLAFDAAGNLCLANENGTISKVTPGGAVSTFVGSGLGEPNGLAFGAAGNLYVLNGNMISEIAPSVIECQSFSGTVFHFTDADPTATASDYTAVVTVGDGNSVKLNSSGVVSGPAGAGGQILADGSGFDVQLSYTYAGVLNNATFSVQVTDVRGASASAGTSTFNVSVAALTAGALTPPHGSGGPTVSTFVNSGLSGPECLAFDSAGNLYVANMGNNGNSTISEVTPGGAVSAFVSSGLSGPIGADGLAFDSAGNLYVGNLGNNTISKVTPDGFVSTFVSSGLNGPIGLAFSAGNLYVANENGMISKVTLTGAVSTFVNSGLSGPVGLAFDAAGNLYVASGNSTISEVTPGGVVSTFVSSGLNWPAGLAFDSDGNLYVGNANSTISKVTPGGAVSTFVSSGLNLPIGLAFNSAGNLYVANESGTISEITPSIIEGQAFSGPVFHFTDADPTGTVSDYMAVVTLGDGNTMTLNSSGVVSGPAGAGGQIVPDGGGFDVQLSYTYAEVLNNATFSVQVNDVRGASASAGTSTFSVSLAALTAGALNPPHGTGGPTVSTFVSSGLGAPEGMAFDALGNLYVANANNTISKVTPGGVVFTFVNIGLNEPSGLAFDSAGNLYVANWGNNTISKVTPTGAVSTFVSSGLNEPLSLAFDAAGNLYVTNYGNSTISKVTPTGAVSAFVSSGLISGPECLGFDAAGNLYVANYGNSTISKVTPTGTVSTFANSGLLGGPVGLAFDAAGNLYVANYINNTISKVTPTGAVSIFVSGGLSGPRNLAFDSAGSLYVFNGNNTISKIILSVIEGQAFNGTVFHFTDADPAATASDYTAVVTLGDGNSVTLNSSGVVSGPAGTGGQIVADGGGFDVQLSYTYAQPLSNQTFSVQVTDVREVSTSAGNNTFNVAVAALTAGALTPPYGTGVPTANTFLSGGLISSPEGLAFDGAGNLYIANYGDNTISEVTPSGAPSAFVSTWVSGPTGPDGMAFDGAGNLYVANRGNNTISKVTPGGAVSTFVSSGLNQPVGLAFDAAGNLYVANYGNKTICEVTPGGAVSTFVSGGLSGPEGMAFDALGNLYVANNGNNTISKVTPTGTVSTFVSSGLNEPVGLAFDSAGNLYVTNIGNNTISKVTPGGAASTFVSRGLSGPRSLAFDSAGNLYVANSNNTVSKITPSVVKGHTFSGTVFHFSDADPTATASDYTIVVTLGDGNTMTLNGSGVVSGPKGASGQIVADGGGFDVQLSYTYAEVLSNATFSVQVTDVRGVATSASSSTFSVSVAALTAGALSPPRGTGGPTVNTFVSSGLSGPEGMAFDAEGNLYVANNGNNTISEVTPGGVVSGFVGSGLNGPEGLAFDAAGNLYVANNSNNTISKVAPTGAVSTFISSGLISSPEGLAFDSAGNLYVANYGNNTICEVTPGGIVSTFVTNGLSGPEGLAFDAAGNLYVASGNSTISEVTPGGVVSTFVSSGLNWPAGLAFDSDGNLYVGNANSTISKVTPGGAVSTFVSSGLNLPIGLAFNSAGNLYVANESGTISEITPSIIEGQAFSGPVFHFTDADPTGTVSDYMAVVTLGDGNTMTLNSSGVVSGPAGAGGQIVPDGGGFDVQLSYTYAEVLNNATFSVQVNDVRGASASAGTSTFSVSLAALTAGALNPPHGTGGPTVSTFVSSGLGAPEGMAFDALGNLYVANANNTISKVTPGGVVFTFVNIGLNEPSGLAFDSAGNLYVANWGNNTISKVTPTGAVSTFVSSGLNEPLSLAFDAAGNLYVTNYGNSTISKVTPTGAVSAFVSSGLISGPECLGFDAAGNLYVANYGNSTISKVTPTGTVSTFANSGLLGGPVGLAFDAAGNLYVANYINNTISKVTPTGAVSIFVSGGLSGPRNLAFDSAGSLYVFNGNNTISKIILSVIEGQAFNGTVFHFTDADPAATASDYTAVVTLGDGNSVTLNSSGVVSGPAGTGGQIVADGGGFDVQLSYTYAQPLSNQTFSVQVTDVREVSTSAGNNTFNVAVAALTAGALTPPYGTGVPTANTFLSGGLISSPEGLAFDGAGNLYIANYGDNTISEVTPSGAPSAFVSTWVSGPTGPDGMAFDGAGNLYVANRGNNTISKVTPGGAVSTFVSSGLNQPVGLAFDAAGNLYVANYGNKTICEVTPGGAVSTFVSGGLSGPEGMAFDALGNLYVANNGNNTISKVTPTGTVSTFVSSGLNEPVGLAFDSAGNLYVTNIGNNTISKVTPGGAASTFVSRGLSGPRSLAFDSAGNLYVANSNNTVSKITPSVVKGHTFSGTVFHFSDADPTATASDYTIVVTLGDGNTMTLNGSGVVSGPKGASGQIVADGGGFDVQLSYTYAEVLSNATFSVQVTDVRGVATSASSSTFSVSVAALTAGALSPPRGTGGPTVNTFVSSGLSGPEGMAFDAEGNLYVANNGNNTISEVTPGGVVSGFVGSGLNGPEGLAFDAAGNLYVANNSNNTISKVAPTGAVSTFISSGLISSPEGLAFDSAGNLYVANYGNNTICEVTPGGIVSTFVTNGLSGPEGLAFDAAGNLYVTNIGNNTISKVTPGGTVSTFVGLSGPKGVAFDSAGNLYVTRWGSIGIYKMTPGGAASIFVSSGLIGAEGLAFDATGNLYVGGYGNSTISKITPSVIEGQAFNGTVFQFTDADPAATASDYTALVALGDGNTMTLNNSGVVNGPKGASGQIVADGAGFDVQLSYTYAQPLSNATFAVQVTDVRGASTIAVTNSFSVAVAALTAGALTLPHGTGGPTISTFVSWPIEPLGLAFDAAGNLYFGNNDNNTICEVTPGGAVSTFVSSGLISSPEGLAFDATGNLYVANYGNNTICEATPTGVVSTFVSGGLNGPEGLAFDAAGNLYVANRRNNTICEVTPTGAISTFVSSGLSHPEGLAFDAAGNLYVANYGNSTISEVTPGGAVSTFLSNGLISGPEGIAFDSAGNLYVANYGNNTISEVTPGGAVSTFLSSGLNGPVGLAFDSAGDLYVANSNNTVSKITPSIIDGQSFSGTVFHFTDADPAATVSDYTAVVTLGDGNTMTLNSSGVVSGPTGAGGQIVADGSGFDVQLSYTYAEVLSNQTFSVQVTDVRGASAIAGISTFSVSDAALTISSVTHPAAVEGIDTGTVTVASFSDAAGSYSNIADLSALITWADGQTSAGTVVATSTPGSYTVTGSHTYAEAISTPSPFTVAANDRDGASASTTIYTATVAEATSLTLSATSGQATYGGAVSLTATLLADGIPLPNETVSFSLGGTAVGTATTNGSGVATLPTLPGIGLAGLNAGVYSDYLAASFNGDASYAGSGETEDLVVNAAPLTVSGVTAQNKVYDSLTATAVNVSGATLAGVLGGDQVGLAMALSGASGTLACKDVGNGIMVTVSGLVLTGPQAGDYTLTPPTAAANITPAPLTVSGVTASDKVYDGTTAATLNTANAALQGVFSGDTVTLDTTRAAGTFSGKNVANGLTVSVAGLTIGGPQAGDYYLLTQPTATANIAALPITVTAAPNTKTYDDTTSAAATPTITSGWLAIGDTAAFSETYDNPNVGTGKTLTPSGSVSDGDGGANYSVTLATNTAGAITQTVNHFVVTASPANITAGNNVILVVTAEDADGRVVAGYAGTVEFTSSDPLEPHPAGNLTFAPGSGVAAAMATLETAGSWAITATDTSNSSIFGATTVMVLAAPASNVVFSQQPSNTSAGATLTSTSGQPVTVEVEDPYGNLVTSSTANVTLAIASGPGALLGTTTVAASGGVASFSNVAIDQSGSHTLIASGAGLGGTATSSQFTITAGAPAQLAFTAQPANTPGADAMANVLVAVEDQYGNMVTTDNSSVTLTLNPAASGGGGVLTGTATQNVSGGVATFSGLSIVDPSNPSWSAAGTGYSLTANDTDAGVNLTAAKSTAFNTTLIVTSCTMTPTGFVATFSQPFKVATTPLTIGPNLYSAAASNDLPVNVSLIGSNEGTVRGSLVVNSTDTQITFVATTLVHTMGLPIAGVSSPDATSGILAPDGYTVVLDSTRTSFMTTNGQLLDGTDSGTGGSNFNQSTVVNNSADVDVVIPSFARGPSGSTVTSAVNVLNASTPIFAGSAMSIATSAKNGATESGNTVTITTTSAHGLVAGQTVLIAGFSDASSGYDGTFTVASIPTTTTFTYTDSTTDLGTSGGGTTTGYGLTESGSTVTVWTTAPNSLAVGEPVTISGAGMAGYNGAFTVASLPGGANGTTFTYTDANVGLANSGSGTAALARGIPISLSGPTSGVTSGTFTLTYSSSDLTISGALVDPSLAASYGATLSLDASSTPGNAIIDFGTTTPLPRAGSTPILLGGLVATVPSAAYYKAKDLLHFSSVSLQAGGSSVATIGADALHLVTFPGNASGSGAITSGDALDMARVVAGADAGFAAYPLIDPDVIGDLLGDGAVDGPDGALLGRYINGVTTPQVPVYPGAPLNKLSVAGSTVSIPSASRLGVGSRVTVSMTVVDAALPVLPDSTASVVAGPVVSVSAGTAVKGTGGISLHSRASAGPARVPQHVADGLFAALGAAVETADSAIVGSGADLALWEALTAQTSAGGSAQADLDRLFWESEDSP